MDYLRQIEEDLNGLINEAKRKYPEVKEAAEKAVQSLRIIREMYVSDVLRKDAASSSSRSRRFPTSSDLSAPYILACNYSDASPKMITVALNGIHMLLNYEVVPPGEVKNILRVLTIQASSGKTDHHMKILQILLLVVNFLSSDETNFQYLTDSTLHSFLSLCLQIGEGKNSISLATTALATVTQMVSVVLDEIEKAVSPGNDTLGDKKSGALVNSVQNLLVDIINFAQQRPGVWIKGVSMPQVNALDILYDIISQRKSLFRQGGIFHSLLIERIISAVIYLLRTVQDDFITTAFKHGLASGASIASRVIRLSRCILLEFKIRVLLDEFNLIITLLLHALQPERSETILPRDSSRIVQEDTLQSHMEKAASLFSVSGGSLLISKLGMSNQTPKVSNSVKSLPSPALYLTLVNAGPTSLSKASNLHINNQSIASQIAAHPAGASLETLLSFFLSDLTSLIIDEEGAKFVSNALISTAVTVAILLIGALGSESNCKDLDHVIRGSQLTTLLEGVLAGAEVDVEYVLRSIHETLVSMPSIEPSDVLVLAFAVLQVVVRLVTKFCLHQASSNILDDEILFSISPYVLRALPLYSDVIQCDALHNYLRNMCDGCFESVHEACLSMLTRVDHSSTVRRSLGILTELAICCGFTGSVKHCNSIITSICKLSVPKWHGVELTQLDLNSNDVESLRWRHVQAFFCLIQIVHLLADVINDWDTIMDAFAQIYHAMIVKSEKSNEDIMLDLQKIQNCFERFKVFTVFICDEALIRLMSSLVALSLNGLGENQKLLTYNASLAPFPRYMKDAAQAGVLSFSFRLVVEVAKLNAYRVSSIWQMITSHLRMVSSQKSPQQRQLAVAATHDVISSALSYMMHPSIPLNGVEFLSAETLPYTLASRFTVCLSDEILFSWVMPSLDTVFLPRTFHRSLLVERAISDEKSRDVSLLRLSRFDLLSSLKIIANVRYDDVKDGVLNGLLSTLQNDGHLFAGAWAAVVEILHLAPLSVRSNITSSSEESDNASSISTFENSSQRWSKQSLTISFNCMKLIIDDFEDLLEVDDVKAVNICLSSFCLQDIDVNISLTSIELLWKISDITANIARGKNDIQTAESVLQQMMLLLKEQSSDSRPMIRHCAMNTLFGSIVVNAAKLSNTTWQFVLNDILFQVFDHAGVRSALAMKLNEDAIAPELKKGVKMAIHHSRDTAHKQWSETQVLALKGLTRVLRACAKLLLRADWFLTTWLSVIEVCKSSLSLVSCELEVSLAGLDLLFSMIKFVSISADIMKVPTDSEDFSNTQSTRELLWTHSWKALIETAYTYLPTINMTLHFCQNLSTLYSSSIDAELKYSQHIRDFLSMIAAVGRSRVVDNEPTAKSNPQDKAAELQLQRVIMELFGKLRSADTISLSAICSTMAEIVFSNQAVVLGGKYVERQITLGPCPLKLRVEISQLLLEIFHDESVQSSSKASKLVKAKSTNTTLQDAFYHRSITQSIDIILRRFVDDIFARAIENKVLTLGEALFQRSNNRSPIPVFETETESHPTYFGIFSAFSKFIGSKTNEISEEGRLRSNSDNGEKRHTSSLNTAIERVVPVTLVNLHAQERKDIWIPCHLPYELRLMKSVLMNGLCDDIPPESWNHLLNALSCILSPWKGSDVDIQDYNLHDLTSDSVDESIISIIEILDTVMKAAEVRAQEWTIPLITSLTITSRLAIYATYNTWIAISEDATECQHAHRLGFAKFYENILDYVRRSFENTFNSGNFSSEAKKVALRGLILLSMDLANYSLKCFKYINSDTNYNPILVACESFLLVLSSLQSSFDTGNFYIETIPPSEADLWTEWLQNFAADKLSKRMAVESDKFGNNHDIIEGIVTGNMGKRSHLLLILPLAQKLIATYDGVQVNAAARIKAAAIDIIDAVDIKILTMSLFKLAEEVKVLKKENNDLKAEVR